MNNHFRSDVSMKSVRDYLKLQTSMKNIFQNEEMLTGEDGQDSKTTELRIRMKRDVSELISRRIRYAQSDLSTEA